MSRAVFLRGGGLFLSSERTVSRVGAAGLFADVSLRYTRVLRIVPAVAHPVRLPSFSPFISGGFLLRVVERLPQVPDQHPCDRRDDRVVVLPAGGHAATLLAQPLLR